MTDVFALSDEVVDLVAAVDPVTATFQGVAGYDHLWPDYSPEGYRARADVWADIARRAQACMVTDDRDALAKAVLVDECAVVAALAADDHHVYELNNIESPHQNLRLVFGSMDAASAEGWEAILARLEGIGRAVESYRHTLELGRVSGRTVAVRQVEAVIEQGRSASSSSSSFDDLTRRLEAWDGATDRHRMRLEQAVTGAKAVFADLNDYLIGTYAPAARPDDAVGRDRYATRARLFLGTTLDWEETYAWGWNEIERLWTELGQVASEIDPSRTSAEVFDLLLTDPAYAKPSVAEFLAFMKDRQLQALDQLDGVHFDVPEPIRTIDVQVEPAGGALAASYIAPSEDFSRPGTVWYPIEGRTSIPVFQEITTAYHEGFPGHHLQIGMQMAQGDRLSRFHRSWVWYPGSGEGWALYAERFMDELGYLERPEYRAGLLASQLLRSCRIVIDIGMHLGLPIPARVSFHPGEPWTFDLAHELLTQRALEGEESARSEVIRYLGWPGQAISYKVGEQAILDLRAEHSRRPDFDLRTFHADLLAVGSVGLDLLRRRMG
ncbi:MAG: DUF885 domain-containing protein [Acidimicrobiia bacterium]|nr:DUF885 domain-containing protein [Acidimicrobiia bacterium]